MNAKQPNLTAYFFAFTAIILAGLLALGQPAEAQRAGLYRLVAHSNQTSNVGIFRINESTGQVSFCFIDTAGTAVKCTAEAQ